MLCAYDRDISCLVVLLLKNIPFHILSSEWLMMQTLPFRTKINVKKIVRLSGIIIQICPLALCAILIRYDFGPSLCGGVRCDKMKRYMCLETPFKAAPHWGSHAGCQLVRWDIFYSL